MSMARFTLSMARTTPAQKPRGEHSSTRSGGLLSALSPARATASPAKFSGKSLIDVIVLPPITPCNDGRLVASDGYSCDPNGSMRRRGTISRVIEIFCVSQLPVIRVRISTLAAAVLSAGDSRTPSH